jgi:hypothetical protein
VKPPEFAPTSLKSTTFFYVKHFSPTCWKLIRGKRKIRLTDKREGALIDKKPPILRSSKILD